MYITIVKGYCFTLGRVTDFLLIKGQDAYRDEIYGDIIPINLFDNIYAQSAHLQIVVENIASFTTFF